jgi:FkbM family methyltransferase
MTTLGWDELKYLDIAKKYFGDKKVVLCDVGENRGDFTAEWLEKFPNTEVYGFEPIPEIYEISKKRFENDDRVNIYNFGLSDESGKKYFYYLLNGYDGCSGSHYREVYSQYAYKEIFVDMKIFDDMFLFPKSDYIKIDVEGHEYFVLLGMEKYIMAYNPKFIQAEIGDTTIDAGVSFKQLWELLESYGYKIMNRDLIFIDANSVVDNYEGQNYLAIYKGEL